MVFVVFSRYGLKLTGAKGLWVNKKWCQFVSKSDRRYVTIDAESVMVISGMCGGFLYPGHGVVARMRIPLR